MCCGHVEREGDRCSVGHGGGDPHCHEEFRFGPAFLTKAEKIARLEECLSGLREKAKMFEERIAALKAER